MRNVHLRSNLFNIRPLETTDYPNLSTADIRRSYNIHGTEGQVMTERNALSLVTCTSCGKPIPPGSESTKFLCPSCGEIQIKRDGKCRKFGRLYKCPKCGFQGP